MIMTLKLENQSNLRREKISQFFVLEQWSINSLEAANLLEKKNLSCQ